MACCEDLTINSYHLKSGSRVLPPLLIEDVAAALRLTDAGICLVLTKTGLLHMWNIELKKSILNRISIRSLLANKGKIEKVPPKKNHTSLFTVTVSLCTLTNSNEPLIMLSDGRAYSYSIDLQTW